ncbi:hypothetical protein ACOME3_004906 [Neoechinorhynchus agilis]
MSSDSLAPSSKSLRTPFRVSMRDLISTSLQLQSQKRQIEVVLKAIKDSNEDRRCYRMISGTLIPRTVPELIIDLENDHEEVAKQLEEVDNAINMAEEP